MADIGNVQSGRGCVYFNFGTAYALQLLVSLYSLRKRYDGPVTVFLGEDRAAPALRKDLESLGADIRMIGDLSRSWDRHRLFFDSPYETTLVFDSDLIFTAPIDDLWAPLEREGLLVTGFHAPPYGVDGSAEKPQWGDRVSLLGGVRGLLGEDLHAEAERLLLQERLDVNVGVMGVSRPRGDDFLKEWSELMERGKSRRLQLLDEMLVLALLAKHQHVLADEMWNCPADEFFRRTNLADARVIHYFGDGARVGGTRLGRNPASWAGRKWYACYREAAESLELERWRRLDPRFAGAVERYVAAAPLHRVYHPVQTLKRIIRRYRKRMARG